MLCLHVNWGYSPDVAGQEVLWKGDSQGESSEKCHHWVKNVSKFNEVSQKWWMPVSDQIVGRRIKKGEKWHLPAFLSLEKVPIDFCPSSTHPKISQCITFTCNLGAFQTAATELWLRKSATLISYSSLALLDISSDGFQSLMGLLFLVYLQVCDIPPAESGE